MRNLYRVIILDNSRKKILDCYVSGFANARFFAAHYEGSRYFSVTRTTYYTRAWGLWDDEWHGITSNRFNQVLRKYNPEIEPDVRALPDQKGS